MKALFFRGFLYLSILPALVFSGCHKEYPDPPTDYLPQNFKDWMFFEKGTYWVYQDSVSGILDSTVVTHAESEIVSLDNEARKSERRIIKKVETLSYYTFSYTTGKEFKYMSSDRCMFTPNYETDQCLYANKFTMQGNESIGITELLFYNMPVKFRSAYSWLWDKYDSLKVGKQYYKDVVLNYQSALDNEAGIESWHYLAKGIGIVQIRQRRNGQIVTQKLIRHNIVQ